MKSVRILSLAVLTTLAAAAHADNGKYPGDFPVSTVQRAQVVAELRAAQAAGQIFSGENYPGGELSAVSTTTRREVIAALNEARHLGLLEARGDGNYPSATPEQERLIAEAGLRAHDVTRSAAR